MLNKDMTKVEIEQALQDMGDFVKIDHLSQLIKEDLALDKKKFVYEKLADIYEKKGMITSAAKIYNNIALTSIAFSDKMKHHVKEAELYIKAGAFDAADDAVKKASKEANVVEKENIYISIKQFYKRQAEAYERNMKRAQAARMYERILEMNIRDNEREEIKTKLMVLYEKLGRLKEYFSLKDNKFDSIDSEFRKK
jgi:tetratricopeptide (TPR) repeat protein